MRKFGARVVQHKNGTIQVLQTIKKGVSQNSPYVCDRVRGKNKEAFVKGSDDAELVRIIKTALAGGLVAAGPIAREESR